MFNEKKSGFRKIEWALKNKDEGNGVMEKADYMK